MACNYYAEKPRHQYKPEFNNSDNPTILYNKCIGNFYNGFYASLINSYHKFNDGMLPFMGGLYDQPAKFVEYMNIVQNLISENNSKKEREAKLRNLNGKRPGKR